VVEIKIACEAKINLSLDELNILQDTNDSLLKELTESAFNKLVQSIVKHGFSMPFLVWWSEDEKKWYYLDGTQRDKALRWMGEQGDYILPEKFPCSIVHAGSKADAAQKILLISSQYGRMTEEGLYAFATVYELPLEDYGIYEIPYLDAVEFYEAYIEDDFGEGHKDPDRKPESKQETNIVAGDLMRLGRHYLLCGDSRDSDVIDRILRVSDNCIDIVFTDPDYDLLYVDLVKCFDNIRSIGSVQFWMGSDRMLSMLAANGDNDFRHYFVHDFEIPKLISKTRPMQQHTLIGKFGGGTFLNRDDQFSTIISATTTRFGDAYEDFQHGKDVALPLAFIEHYCSGSGVLDIFGGEGSTLMACELSGKACYMIEIEPLNCQLIVDRWEQFTDKKMEKIDNEKDN
jgi:DNA modification methylase